MKLRALLAPLLLAAAAAGLFALDAALDARAAASRGAGLQLLPLVTDAEADALRVAALRVSLGDGRAFFYARSDGLWRCLDHHRALVDEAAVERAVQAVLDAVGSLDPVPPEALADWGFGTPDTLTVRLHGPGARADDPAADVQLELSLGASLPELGGGFARRPGDDGVRTLDSDLRALFAPDGDVPALLDPTLLGAVSLPRGRRVSDALVARAGAPPFRLEERPSGATEEMLAQGASPWVHVVVGPDGTARPTVGVLITSFEVFLANATWSAVLDPARAPELGIGEGSPRLVVRRDDGTNLGLLLGRAGPDGGVPVVNAFTGQLMLVDPITAAALQPAPEAFLPGTPRNLWDPWLGRGGVPGR